MRRRPAHHRPPRRGVALMDAILAGVMLGMGLAVILSLASRSLSQQAEGRRQIVAAWLTDELLGMVLVEGPEYYQQLHPDRGQFDPPFEDYEYFVEIKDIGLRMPYRVTAIVTWEQGADLREVSAQTYIAQRQGDPLELRAPLEPIDRIGRWYGDDEY